MYWLFMSDAGIYGFMGSGAQAARWAKPNNKLPVSLNHSHKLLHHRQGDFLCGCYQSPHCQGPSTSTAAGATMQTSSCGWGAHLPTKELSKHFSDLILGDSRVHLIPQLCFLRGRGDPQSIIPSWGRQLLFPEAQDSSARILYRPTISKPLLPSTYQMPQGSQEPTKLDRTLSSARRHPSILPSATRFWTPETWQPQQQVARLTLAMKNVVLSDPMGLGSCWVCPVFSPVRESNSPPSGDHPLWSPDAKDPVGSLSRSQNLRICARRCVKGVALPYEGLNNGRVVVLAKC